MRKAIRIIDHAFVPNEDEQLSDYCTYENCGCSELEHEWTVDAREANPPKEVA